MEIDESKLGKEYMDFLDGEIEKQKRGEHGDCCSYREWKFHYKKIPIEKL